MHQIRTKSAGRLFEKAPIGEHYFCKTGHVYCHAFHVFSRITASRGVVFISAITELHHIISFMISDSCGVRKSWNIRSAIYLSHVALIIQTAEVDKPFFKDT